MVLFGRGDISATATTGLMFVFHNRGDSELYASI